MMPLRQTGAHFVVSGGSRGIGRAVARRLAAEGASVTVLGRDEKALREVDVELRSGGMSSQFFLCDVRDPSSIREAVERAVGARGPLRGVVAAAGIGGSNSAGPTDRWDELLATNLSGTYHLLRAAEGHLEAGKTTHMVALSSILGRFGVPGYTGYCASKAGLLGLVRALALELAPRDVQVNALCPGWVDTDMAREGIEGIAAARGLSYDEARKRELRVVPLGRMSTPEEIAGLVAWLVSPDARGVTGQGLDMNNGAWMG